MEDCFLRGTDPDWSFKDAVPINRHIIWDNEGNTSKITLQLHSNHYPLIEAYAGYRRLAMQTPCLSARGEGQVLKGHDFSRAIKPQESAGL